ncbi:hypothetical protein [Candidatus Spongiisocius sp.]|uniref:hypothetical protein n=1 Tax=Candidatus Spongiisocius sp. TaxID=3101273 RepID=UPI003B59DEE3
MYARAERSHFQQEARRYPWVGAAIRCRRLAGVAPARDLEDAEVRMARVSFASARDRLRMVP